MELILKPALLLPPCNICIHFIINISGGTFTIDSTSDNPIIYNTGLLNIDGGSFTTNTSSIIMNYNNNTNATVNITDGSFENTRSSGYESSYSIIKMNGYNGGKLNISGGTFTNNVNKEEQANIINFFSIFCRSISFLFLKKR